MAPNVIFATVDEFELGYAGDDTPGHEQAAFERAGEQDSYCMICLRHKPKLFPHLSPGDIHYCPRKFCEDCCRIPEEWRYKPTPRISAECLEKYYYCPIACWVCQKRGWDYICPLLGPKSPEWSREFDPDHERISLRRYLSWALCEEDEKFEDVPRVKYRKLLDRFSRDPQDQLRNDRRLLQSMKNDVLKPGVQFASLLPGGRLATRPSSPIAHLNESPNATQKYEERPSFDTALAFRGACRWLRDLDLGALESENHKRKRRRVVLGDENEESESQGSESNWACDSQDEYSPPSPRRRSSRKKRRLKSQFIPCRNSVSRQQGGPQPPISASKEPHVHLVCQESAISSFPKINDSTAIEFEFHGREIVIKKNEWKDRCGELASYAEKLRANTQEHAREITESQKTLQRVQGLLTKEKSRTLAVTASAELTNAKINQLEALASAAERESRNLMAKFDQLQNQYKSLKEATVGTERAKEEAMSESKTLRCKVTGLESEHAALMLETERLRNAAIAAWDDRRVEATEAEEKFQQLTSQYGHLTQVHTELESNNAVLTLETDKLRAAAITASDQRLEEATDAGNKIQWLSIQCDHLKQVNTELEVGKTISDLTVKVLKEMLTESSSDHKIRRDMLREEREETQNLQRRIADLELNNSELRADEAAFGFRALKIQQANEAELKRRLATGHVTPELVGRLSNSEPFQ